MFSADEVKNRMRQGLLDDLGDKERIVLFNMGQLGSVGAKETLFKKGSTGKNIYCVVTGRFRAGIGDGDRLTYRFSPGDWIAETGFSAPPGRISSVVAEEPSTVLAFSQTAFQSLNHEIQASILKKLYDRNLSRMTALAQEKMSAQFQGAALSKYIRKNLRKLHGKYEHSEIILNIIQNIPRLPLHITQLIELLSTEMGSAKDVADLARQDPSLVCDILKTINSSRYALQKEISDISYAITYLGFNEVYQIAVSRGLMKSMPDSEAFRNIHRHSLFLSYIASELCHAYDKNRASLLGTIALLHEVGESILLLLEKQNPKWSLFIGMLDAAKVGAMLLSEWNIPKQVCLTIEYQSYPLFCPPSEVPQEQRINIALLYVAHVAFDYIYNRPIDALDNPFLDDYLDVLNLRSRSIEQIAQDCILKGLRAKAQRLPDFVRKMLAAKMDARY